MQSSKCKIPWTDRDIEEAYNRAAEDLDDYSLEEEVEKKEDESLRVKDLFYNCEDKFYID